MRQSSGTYSIITTSQKSSTDKICLYIRDQHPFSLYEDAIFIDQSSRIEMNGMNKPVAYPTSSLMAFCHNGVYFVTSLFIDNHVKECLRQYNIERDRNYTRDAQLAVACYANAYEVSIRILLLVKHTFQSSGSTFVCSGHACYAKHFNGTTARGCFDYIFDTKWADGSTHFQYLLEDRRVEAHFCDDSMHHFRFCFTDIFQKVTIHQFLLLEFYFCSYDYCNFDDVSTKVI